MSYYNSYKKGKKTRNYDKASYRGYYNFKKNITLSLMMLTIDIDLVSQVIKILVLTIMITIMITTMVMIIIATLMKILIMMILIVMKFIFTTKSIINTLILNILKIR